MVRPSWDAYFMAIAETVSQGSKDPSRKIGAIIVSDGRVISTGFNRFPRGVDDTVAARLERPLKYKFTVHAERVAILNAAALGIATFGSQMYVTGWLPCEECAKAIIDAGIKEVITQRMTPMPGWEEPTEIGMTMMGEAGVPVRPVEK